MIWWILLVWLALSLVLAALWAAGIVRAEIPGERDERPDSDL